MADAQLRAELPNLRAAWDLSRSPGPTSTPAPRSWSDLDDLTTYRDLPEVAEWAVELAADPRLADHPQRVEVLGAAANSAWRPGDIERAIELAERAIAETRPRPQQPCELGRRAQTAAVFRGDPSVAADLVGAAWRRESDAGRRQVRRSRRPWPPCTAATTSGPVPCSTAPWRLSGQAAPSNRAFAVYTAAEMAVAGADPDRAVELYGEAIALARSVGATFVEGVASVGLVRLWGASGRTRPALEGYRTLLVDWRRSGHWTQVWTTLRNLATLLARVGQPEAGGDPVDGRRRCRRGGGRAGRRSWPSSWPRSTEALDATLGGRARGRAPAQAAVQLPRGEVVDAALAAIDAALA